MLKMISKRKSRLTVTAIVSINDQQECKSVQLPRQMCVTECTLGVNYKRKYSIKLCYNLFFCCLKQTIKARNTSTVLHYPCLLRWESRTIGKSPAAFLTNASSSMCVMHIICQLHTIWQPY